MSLTRRLFLERIAAVGGAGLAYESMTALGLVAQVAPAPFDLRGEVDGVRVIVLGAGLAGLTVAYELEKLGYRCQVLEARHRPGGRAHTVRRGSRSEEDGPPQLCAFDEGLYLNPGAMRIPHHHITVLNYCRELNVPVEVFAVAGDSTYLYQQKAAALAGRRVRLREARTDLDGYVAELLTKALSQEELDARLTREDREKLLEYLKRHGALDEKGQYRGSPDRGPGDAAGTASAPLPLGDLLGSGVGGYLDSGYQYQPTMLQVVGGMDRLPAAFAARLRDRIVYRAAAREIRQSETGVSVSYADHSGKVRNVDGDYCVCAIPLTILSTLDTDFSPEFRKAAASVTYAAAGKIGLQFKRRFWEEDDGIYGGATRTDQEIAQIVYPSHGFHARKGVLIGYYVQGEHARPVGERTPAERLRLALEQGGRIHPQYATEFENGFSVGWHRVTWNRGSWASFSAETRKALPLLSKPQGRVYLAGDHLNMNAWMQGAFESARQVATAIHARTMAERPRRSVA
jgi:monoamine oxidase